ncbi:hypothetical protein DY000_02050825 [Brassica cretica]|uniref:Uncharacterized protein n=1 Tax=Brassica cretica TaxID=69181 RepID=A0ABQ7EW94_BRACR|nr:hypothetical protein DY000_02050825 [Brassica cretica]
MCPEVTVCMRLHHTSLRLKLRPKDKTRRSLLPGKFAKERDSILDNLYPFWTNAMTGPSSSPQAASSTNGTEEELETKKEVVSGQEAETQEEVLEPMDERKLSISS